MTESTSDAEPVVRTRLGLADRREGKVRDVYTWADAAGGEDRLVLVATDRISAFDVVLPTPIPGKGVVLTGMASWWLRWIERRGLARTHLVSTEADLLPEAAFRGTSESRRRARGRVMIARRCRVVPIECVVRGHLEGSAWREYERTGMVCGIKLKPGLRRCERLPEPIFTPATKAERGAHDENITFDHAGAMVGHGLIERLRERSLAIYDAARAHAAERGIIIADTKLEFGFPLDAQGEPDQCEPILVDEALTPDSSRFWPAEGFEPGRAQPSFDKQYVREHLQRLIDEGRWDGAAPGPELPPEIVAGTIDRYREALDRLTHA